VRATLDKLDSELTTVTISKLNLEVTAKLEQPAAVAKAWLESKHLI
jgi:glycine betaine/choline ABC-type transport system substrate-binding protein